MLNIKDLFKDDRTILEKRSKGQKVLFGIVFALLVLYSFTLLIPFAWVFISTFKDQYVFADVTADALALPEKWLFQNWLDVPKYLVVNEQNYFVMLFNTLWLTIGRTTLYILVKVMAGYCVAKYACKFTKVYYAVALFQMMLPLMGGSAATYKLYWGSGIADSPLILLAATGGMGFDFIMMTGFFKSLSNSYSEAARLDGAGHHQIFWRISLPLVLGPISALYIMALIGFWNDYYISLMYMPSYHTIASGLFVYKQVAAQKFMNMPVYYAGVIVSTIPAVVVFIFFQDKIMTSITVGGLKG